MKHQQDSVEISLISAIALLFSLVLTLFTWL